MLEDVIARMAALLEPLEAAGDKRRYFHATYQRTTIAVAAEIRRGGFTDAGWVERWDVAFACLYLNALETDMAGGRPSRPWAIAFGAPAGLPPLRHVLLGMNAHINYDLPQAGQGPASTRAGPAQAGRHRIRRQPASRAAWYVDALGASGTRVSRT